MVDFNPRNFRMWSMMGLNPCIWSIAFPEVIAQHAETVALTADLARYSGMMRTWNANPDRFYNVGIAEQNMVGIAAGLAMCGQQVFMTTYAPFMTYRCADQLRHLVGNHNLDIKAIGSAAGLSAGLSGSSLLAVSDIAFARSIPNMTVLSPADCTEAMHCSMKPIAILKGMESPLRQEEGAEHAAELLEPILCSVVCDLYFFHLTFTIYCSP